MSTVATFGLLGSVLGPLLGGALVEYTSWRLIFLINVPVAIAGVWMNRRDMPEYRLERANRFDILGFLLFAVASALLLAASELAGGSPVPWAGMAACSGIAVLLGIAVLDEHIVATPGRLALLAAATVVLLAGIVVLDRSPNVHAEQRLDGIAGRGERGRSG